nr:MAG TPA: upper collar protein [Caudoviricetes sp.]
MKKLTETDIAMNINNLTYIDYINRLKLIATSLFTWKGLDEVAGFGASRFLELVLYENGRACFVKDSEKGYLALRVNPSDKLNVYLLPEKVMAWSLGYNKNYLFDDVIYIMNNNLEIPTSQSLQLFAYRLYETERTIDTNLIAQKTPVLIEGDTKTILTLKNVYMQYSGNTPFIFGNKQFDISNKLNVLKTDAPYLIDKLEDHKHEIWNEALTYLGINNANTDKKERLITSEVESNDDLINYYLNCFYKTRKDACDRINEKYNLNIELTLNKEVLDLLNLSENDIINYEEGEEDGEIYNNN